MALEGFLPPLLEPKFSPLWRYLQARDTGAPSAAPVPGRVLQVALAGDTIETLHWGFVEAAGEDVLHADGFVFAWQLSSGGAGTGEPTATRVLCSLEARSFQCCWPNDAVRSYAVAAFRITYAGMIVGPPQTRATWVGVT